MNKQEFKTKYITVDNTKFSKEVKTLINNYCSTEDLVNVDKVEFIDPIFKSSKDLDASMLSYSSITTTVFKYNDEKKENKLEDIGVFLREALREHYENRVVGTTVSPDYRERYMVIKKFIEHMDLAINQKENLYTEQRTQINELNEEVESAKRISNSTSKKIDGQLSGIYAQFVAILGIFTSIMFAVLGGFNEMKTLAQSMTSVPIPKLLIFTALLMLGINFLVFLSYNAISKLTKLPLKSCGCEGVCNCLFRDKHPTVFYSSAFFIYVMFIGFALRLYKYNDFTFSNIFDEYKNNDLLPLILLIALPCIFIIWIFWTSNTTKKTIKNFKNKVKI